MEETFGSTCHGAGRACSRNNSRNKLDYQQVGGLGRSGGTVVHMGRAIAVLHALAHVLCASPAISLLPAATPAPPCLL